MWEINRHIREKEKVIYEGTPEYVSYFWLFVIALVLIFTIIVPLLIILFVFLTKMSTKYVITDKRVGTRRGIVTEDFKSATFKFITATQVRQGIIGRLFNYGSVIIDTAGTGIGVSTIWGGVKDPIKVKNMIEKKIDHN
ncbi:hypothetical protein CMO83_05280 [Candidatus Woesearchaeota archaeon]|jgi:uncharacterized membrane protein YdbT with pleckstrin-like domain|nr:hypothetical protein [Candidatus Woesearchaeota archaeon]|tara:strand:+ start:2941 stop:3357 length:417 start_codon:yes stop_codon:yes gene_type:complete